MSENTETIIYAFIILCISIIIFDIVQIFRLRYRDRKVNELAADNRNISLFLNNPSKLKNETNILAFERGMDKEAIMDIDSFNSHILTAKNVFPGLICDQSFDDVIVKSYMVYLSSKYNLFFHTDNEVLKNELLYMITETDIYVRENALSCIFSIGDAQFVYIALKTLDNSDIHHNEKLLHDGLLKFKGDMEQLTDLLLSEFNDFSIEMQIMISNFFRFSTSKYVSNALDILKDSSADRELRLSALRYLQKNHYAPAVNTIIDYANNKSDFWEYRAIAASCLGSYPCKESIEVLKMLTTDPEWYVRKNAAESLAKLNVDNDTLKDILDGNDRFAKEQAQYVIDRIDLAEAEAK